MAPILQTLRDEGFVLALVSNCSSEVRDMLQEHQLEQHFHTCVLSAEVGVRKPDSAIFELATRQCGADRAIFVGDGDNDELEGARRVGLVDVLLDLGDHRTATHVIPSIAAVPSLARKVLA